MSLGVRFKLLLKTRAIEIVKFCAYTSVGGVAYIAFDNHIGTFRRVEGPSMAPTFNALEYSKEKFEDKNPTFAARDNLTNPDLGYFTRSFEPQRGDVVLVVDPKNSNNYLIKRIIGLEGDTIVPLGFNQVEREPLKLKKDQVWVESDAGYGYRDSNIFGPVHIKSIQGKALFSYNLFQFKGKSIESFIPEKVSSRLTISD